MGNRCAIEDEAEELIPEEGSVDRLELLSLAVAMVGGTDCFSDRGDLAGSSDASAEVEDEETMVPIGRAGGRVEKEERERREEREAKVQ